MAGVVAAFDAAMSGEGPNIPWEQVKADLGWEQALFGSSCARRPFERLGGSIRRSRRRIQGAIALLAEDPRPPAARKLQGRDGLRVRVVDYRIIYTVEDDVLLVVVVTLGHRREVYDR